MAVLRKKLTPESMVKGYFFIKEDISAISKLAASDNKEVRDTAMKGLNDIKASIPKFEKEIEKTRKRVEGEYDSYEDASMDRVDDVEFNEQLNAYEQDIVMMDFLAEDAKQLYALVDECEKIVSGEKIEKQSTDSKEPKNYEEYVEYTKEAIAIAKKQRDAEPVSKVEISSDTLTNVGMVSSAVVAATNPILGSTLMVANLVAKNHHDKTQTEQQNQPGE